MAVEPDHEVPVRVLKSEVLADDWAKLTRYTIDYRRRDGERETLIRQVYDRGDGAAILPYDPARGTVLLVRQFRMPVYLRAHSGWLIEACAGLLDDRQPEAAILREAREELGYELKDISRVLDVLMSPGSVNEQLALFTARYTPADRVSSGGGAEDEGEDIEVLEVTLDDAMA
ncbi:MAG: NUDIX domain-containing protein, partial [bacterium]|nr:NUDIX domain-containing protein [bacterium]